MIAEIKIKVSFAKHTLIKKDLGVVQGDYNTTKLVFDFEEDVSGHTILFKMMNPQGYLIIMEDLTDGEILLSGKDADGKVCSLFEDAGLYPFELVAYSDDGKLTSAPGWLNVNKRQVPIDDVTFAPNVSYLDQIVAERIEAGIDEVQENITERANELVIEAITDCQEATRVASMYGETLRILDERISNILAQNNDTEGNAELVDIRMDIDGNIHATAGDAVRSQIRDLASAGAPKITVTPSSKITEVVSTSFMLIHEGYAYRIPPMLTQVQYQEGMIAVMFGEDSAFLEVGQVENHFMAHDLPYTIIATFSGSDVTLFDRKGNIDVDGNLSLTSTNPIQNRAVAEKFEEIVDLLGDKVDAQTLGQLASIVDGKASMDEVQDILMQQHQTAQEVFSELNENKADKTYVDSLMNGAVKRDFVDGELGDPADFDTNTIYMLQSQNSGENNIYDEYMVINGKWECIGSTAIDLTPYQRKLYATSGLKITEEAYSDEDGVRDVIELDENSKSKLDAFGEYTQKVLDLEENIGDVETALNSIDNMLDEMLGGDA